MKHILIVDDNVASVTMLSRVFEALRDIFKVFTTNNGKDAIDIIEQEQIDLVLTELNLPQMNGIALIKHILNSKSGIPIIILTAYGTPEIESKLNSIPSIRYFNKPIKTDIVIETVFENLNVPFGQVDGVGLSSFCQLLEMEAKTCTLSIMSNQQRKTGVMYFLNGVLISAETESHKNEDAAYEILSWEDAKIHIVYSVSKKEQEITQSLMNILMEGARQRDEEDGIQSEDAGRLATDEKILSEEGADNDSIQVLQDAFDKTFMEDGALPGDGESQPEDGPSPPHEGSEKKSVEMLLQSGPLAEVLVKMKESLVKVMGPIADIVFLDCLEAWVEGIVPSESSIPSLIDIIDQEIGDFDRAAKYRTLIEPYI